MKGIRLDSGDLAYLSIQARRLLDEAGFKNAKIAASNDLDEGTMASLIDQGAKIDVWGVGTNLVTAKSQPALGGVYKLGAIYGNDLTVEDIQDLQAQVKAGKTKPDMLAGKVRNVLKLSEQAVKVSIPGELDVLRFMRKNHLNQWTYNGDMIVSNNEKDVIEKSDIPEFPFMLKQAVESVRKYDETLSKVFNKGTYVYKPLKPAFDKGVRVSKVETVHDARARAKETLSKLHYAHKRLLNPRLYVAGLENGLYERRRAQMLGIRRGHKIGEVK